MKKLLPITVLACTSISACSWHEFGLHKHGINSEPPAMSNDEACAAVQSDSVESTGDQLDGRQIKLLNWNTQKHGNTHLHDDLIRFSSEADLVLLQEAVVDADHLTKLDDGIYWNFAPGYIKSGVATGVMTASKVRPSAYCKLASTEPWLGSPKATSITLYPLRDSNESLLVINMHIVNFTFGIGAVQQQLDDAMLYVDAHQGPVVISGDMNTWSDGREELVTEELKNRGFESVIFSRDERTRIFGHVIDHIYVRGMQWTTAKTFTVNSSDHNPISAVLKVY
jgi:endonuclease/exonuclease/phosphatase (EEP) superfamily protein YafD